MGDTSTGHKNPKRLGYVRLNPLYPYFKDDMCSGIELTRKKPVAPVFDDMDDRILVRAIQAKILAKQSRARDPWPHKPTNDRAKRQPIMGLQPYGKSTYLMHQDFSEQLRSDPNWQVLSSTDIGRIIQYIEKIDNGEVIKKMLHWETTGKTRQSLPRYDVVEALSKKQKELKAPIQHEMNVEETEIEIIHVKQ